MRREAKLLDALRPAAGHRAREFLRAAAVRDSIASTQLDARGVRPDPARRALASGAAAQVLDAISATGYGLTLGVHSRIDETRARRPRALPVGNIYVNRNMIGAVVGVQPFGGEGLSGTGPKAGGPHYL